MEYRLSMSSICYVGDRGLDLATADAAGTAGVGVSTGDFDIRLELGKLDLFPVFDSLEKAVEHILNTSE